MKLNEIKWKFDACVFSMVLHNLHPIGTMQLAMKSANACLKKGGLLFTLDPHPCFEHLHLTKDSSRKALAEAIYKKDYPIRITLNPKKGKPTIIMNRHRPLKDYIHAIASAGFKIESIGEVTAPDKFRKKYKLEYRFPFFIIFKARKIT